MRPAALLCVASLVPAVAGIALDGSTIRTAVAAWLANATAAEATYGHISTWETGGVTDMSYLFCAYSSWTMCNTAAASFNEDIGAWDTSGVTSMKNMFIGASAFDQDIGDWAVHRVRDMYAMFRGASSFDQDISGWAVQSVTTMNQMFNSASAFDQDLGWCVADDVDLRYAFRNNPCEPTYCGVMRKNEFDECEAIVDDDAFDLDFGGDDDRDDDDDDWRHDDYWSGNLGSDAATTRSAALAALVLGAALA